MRYAALESRIAANVAREKEHLAARLGEMIDEGAPLAGPSTTPTSAATATSTSAGPMTPPAATAATGATEEEDRIRENINRVKFPASSIEFRQLSFAKY